MRTLCTSRTCAHSILTAITHLAHCDVPVAPSYFASLPFFAFASALLGSCFTYLGRNLTALFYLQHARAIYSYHLPLPARSAPLPVTTTNFWHHNATNLVRRAHYLLKVRLHIWLCLRPTASRFLAFTATTLPGNMPWPATPYLATA